MSKILKQILSAALSKFLIHLFFNVIPSSSLGTAIAGCLSFSVIMGILYKFATFPPVVFILVGFLLACVIIYLGYRVRKKWNLRCKMESKPDYIPKTFEETMLFFECRLRKAFYDVNGVKEFKAKEGLDRLMILLEKPISFDSFNDPMWYFRDISNLPIYGIRRISRKKCQLELFQGRVLWNLTIRKVIVSSTCSGAYYQNFVYVETEGEKPSKFNSKGAEYEEYGLLRTFPFDKMISRKEYDNGHTKIMGKIRSTDEAELHTQYTVPYNFIIVSKASPFNSSKFDQYSESFFEGILKGTKKFDDLLNFLKTFNKYER